MANSNILSVDSMLPSQLNEIGNGITYVGIDFGTSTTVVSVAAYDGNEIIVTPIRIEQLLEDGTRYQSEKLPSVIAWYKQCLLVGEGASNLKYKLKKGKNIWYSFKMEIGEDLGAKYYDSEIKDLSGINIKNPKDCVRIFFMFLKKSILNYCNKAGLSTDIRYAVSIPASFEANQRKELMEALEVNGMNLSNQSLIDEPNAAFISYVHESQNSEHPLLISPDYNSKVLVFDFGGGTCDISILEIGKSYNGFYSKNVAISKFTKLGGDDIDRYITYHYIMPRFLEYNNKKASDFITNERKYIATQLYKVSERLKILICKSLSTKLQDLLLPDFYKNSDDGIQVDVPITIETTQGVLRQNSFILRYSEMSKVMEVFTKSNNGIQRNYNKFLFINPNLLSTKLKGEEEYNSIFMPIDSAVQKANLTLDELDYVLLIGGSAQNPYMQEAIKKYFEDSKILVPADLQTHVSQGTAIHSLLMNGYNKCIIQSITSEPIFVITKDAERRRMLVPAGTQIPTDTVVVDDLSTIRDNQEVVELPICVGSENKMLYNLKITRNDGKGFPVNAQVKITMEIDADKLLLVQAECMGVKCRVEPQNPFANKELTTEERIVLQAERQANIDAERNGGVPTKNGLINLRRAYEKAGNDFSAAETYEMQYQMYPSSCNLNEIGVLYHNSGNQEKAIQFYELALKEYPDNGFVNFNLGHCLLRKDPVRAEKLLKRAYELNPRNEPLLIVLAGIEDKKGNASKAIEFRQKAFDSYMKTWKAGRLRGNDFGWFERVARELEHLDTAYEIGNSEHNDAKDEFYNKENLTRTNISSIEQK